MLYNFYKHMRMAIFVHFFLSLIFFLGLCNISVSTHSYHSFIVHFLCHLGFSLICDHFLNTPLCYVISHHNWLAGNLFLLVCWDCSYQYTMSNCCAVCKRQTPDKWSLRSQAQDEFYVKSGNHLRWFCTKKGIYPLQIN